MEVKKRRKMELENISDNVLEQSKMMHVQLLIHTHTPDIVQKTLHVWSRNTNNASGQVQIIGTN